MVVLHQQMNRLGYSLSLVYKKRKAWINQDDAFTFRNYLNVSCDITNKNLEESDLKIRAY